MLLFIDHFDSFTYNLVHCFEGLGAKTKVVRDQSLSVQECLDLCPRYIVIGPGPGSPSQATLAHHLIHAAAGKIPILGVCLGHQIMAEAFGGEVIRASTPFHGKTSPIIHTNAGVFRNLPQGFLATRYHSLIVNQNSMPACLTISAHTSEYEIMGIRHRELPIEGIQFHPESILTEHGLSLLTNFLDNTYS